MSSNWRQKPTAQPIPLSRPYTGKEELNAVKNVLESGWITQGPMVRRFEETLARLIGAKHVIATSSGTAALTLALEVARVPAGCEVIVPDFTHPATGNVVVRHGAHPVIVDVTRDTYAMDLQELRRGVTGRTKAIIVVHPFGHPAELDEVYEVAQSRGLIVIEDAATALGSRYKERMVGSSSRLACFSFHPRKLITTGEGGALVTDDGSIAERARALRSHGMVPSAKNGPFLLPGHNFRMSDLQAAVGLGQLAKFDEIVGKRRRQAKFYSKLLTQADIGVKPPMEATHVFSTFQAYVTYLTSSFKQPRDLCMKKMWEEFNIETQVGTYSLHTQPAFAASRKMRDLQVGEELFNRTLTLPAYHTMTEEQQVFVVEALKRLWSQ